MMTLHSTWFGVSGVLGIYQTSTWLHSSSVPVTHSVPNHAGRATLKDSSLSKKTCALKRWLVNQGAFLTRKTVAWQGSSDAFDYCVIIPTILSRSDSAWKKIFMDAGLKLLKQQIQEGFPQGLYAVKMCVYLSFWIAQVLIIHEGMLYDDQQLFYRIVESGFCKWGHPQYDLSVLSFRSDWL